MTTVGVTGHRSLHDEVGVLRALETELAAIEPPLVGVSALAEGADQLFARAVLDAGGSLEVIVPGADYRARLSPRARAGFDELTDAAAIVTTLDYTKVGREAYLAAGLSILDRCDVLFAVWDGEESRGDGGTADVVRRARARGVPVVVIDAERSGEPDA